MIELFDEIIKENNQKLHDVFKDLPVSACVVCKDTYIIERTLKFFFSSRNDFLDINDVSFIGNWEDTIGIDSVREMENEFFVYPSKKEKYLVINAAEKLTIESSNALLKIVEEPPKFGGIIFATKNWYSLLPTIRSRLLKIDFRIPNTGDVLELLNDLGFSKEESQKILFLSKIDLSVFEALRNSKGNQIKEFIKKRLEDVSDEDILLQDEISKIKRFLFYKELFFKIITKKIERAELLSIYERFSKFLSGKKGFKLLVEIIKVFSLCLRDLLIISEGVDPNVIYNKDFLGEMILNEWESKKVMLFIKRLERYLKLSYGKVDTRMLLLYILLKTYLIDEGGNQNWNS